MGYRAQWALLENGTSLGEDPFPHFHGDQSQARSCPWGP